MMIAIQYIVFLSYNLSHHHASCNATCFTDMIPVLVTELRSLSYANSIAIVIPTQINGIIFPGMYILDDRFILMAFAMFYFQLVNLLQMHVIPVLYYVRKERS